MIFNNILSFVSLLYIVIGINAYVSYENYKVYDVIPKTEKDVQILKDLKKESYDFWTDTIIINSIVRIMVSPEKNNDFINNLNTNNIKSNISISNVQTLINAQMQNVQRNQEVSLGSLHWNGYHNLSIIHSWLDELQDTYPNIVQTITIGTSLEGRAIKGVIIDFKPNERGDSPLIGMIEGGIHSREWISPATVTWIIKEFLSSNDPDVKFLAEAFVWHIFPVVNPDGYVYSFEGDRMWRKNRNPANFVNCNVRDDLSNGIDLNRNFDFLWMTTGASSNPCDQTFAGASAGSEAETRAISNHVLSLKQDGNMIYYISFHSYSQMILIPYSHVSGNDVLQVSNYADLYEIAIRGAEKLTSLYGTEYEVGTSADILYEVSGSSFDWVKGVAEIPIVYLFELRDTPRGPHGFLLPAEQIIPNNEEIMACLIEMDKTTRTLGYYSHASYTAPSMIVVLFVSIFLAFFK